MALSIVGSASAAADSIAIPTHQVGDEIVIFAYRDGATTGLTKPSSGGTVPAWVDIDTLAGSNTNCSLSARFTATATNTTSGTWTNATGLSVVVLRGQAAAPIGGHANDGGAGDPVSPNITPSVTDGSSVQLHFFAHRSVTAWGSAPTGFTRLTEVATECCVNTKNSTASGTGVTQSLTRGAGGYRGMTVEILAAASTSNRRRRFICGASA